jgi:hypothetical protein
MSATKPKKQSRPERWAEACAEARTALDAAREAEAALVKAMEPIEAAFETLRELKGEYEEWQGRLPESLSSSPVGEKLEAVTSIDLPDNGEDLDAVEAVLDECEGADLPRGFGND